VEEGLKTYMGKVVWVVCLLIRKLQTYRAALKGIYSYG